MRRRRRPVGHVSHERWLVSYADFITLLFAFFVVLYSAAQVDKKKVGKLAEAIQVAFQQMGAFPAEEKSETPPSSPANISQSNEPNANPQQSDMNQLRKELEKALQQEIARGDVALRSQPNELVISLREVGFFESGSAGITARSQSAFARMAILLARRKFNLRIEGHTDNVPIHTSQFSSNWELSTARATEMVRLLITQYQFSPDRLSAAGYGQYHPLASNDTEAGRALNRRVDIVIISKGAMAGASAGSQEH